MTNTKSEIEIPIKVTSENLFRIRKEIPFFARKVFELLVRIEKGSLKIRLPNRKSYYFDSGNHGIKAILHLKNWRLARNTVFSGTIGVAESYINEDWDSPDVTALLYFFLANRSIYNDLANHNPIISMIENFRHWLNRNTPSGSKRNIAAHYDLGNDFYSLWLDKSITYSSAIFADGANSLERAQEDKHRSLAKRLNIKPDSHVLEIGCGWGSFAEFVARQIGAKVTGLTISQKQLEYARNRIRKAGLQDRVEFKFQDYRDEKNKYDQIVSIEMFEAVGEQYWPTYFKTIRNCLKPGGLAGFQIITICNEDYHDYRKRADFIQRYIFPGGMLPSAEVLEKITSAQGLKLTEERIFPQDYARTLREWRKEFNKKWDQVTKLGFDQRFKRMWEFYLYYCEAGFKSEVIDVRQMLYRHA